MPSSPETPQRSSTSSEHRGSSGLRVCPATAGGSWPTLLDNVDEILATQDTLLLKLRFDDEARANLVAFLRALTDEAARDLGHTIPNRVPSGLPVDRISQQGFLARAGRG